MSKLKSTYLGLFMLFFGFLIIAMTTNERVPNQQQDRQVISGQITLEGTVVDGATGDLLSEVEVNIKELSETVTTDTDGLFVVENLAEGETYTLEVDHDGYEKYEETIDAITMGSPILEVRIELTPSEQEEM